MSLKFLRTHRGPGPHGLHLGGLPPAWTAPRHGPGWLVPGSLAGVRLGEARQPSFPKDSFLDVGCQPGLVPAPR